MQEVEGLVLWKSAPEYIWVENEDDLTRHANEQLEYHLNLFLDAWFRDNAVEPAIRPESRMR